MKYKLGDLISLINGYTFKRKDFIDEGIPVTKIKNIVSPYVNIQLDPSYVSLKYNLEDKFQIHYGDILIALTGSNVSQKNSMVGKIGRYLDHRISYLNQRVGKIKVTSPKLDEDYLYYWLVRPQVRYYLALNAGGSANQANISAKSIYDLEIDLPNIDEQKRIVRKLITIDQQTSLNNQINANLLELAINEFQHQFGNTSGNNHIGDYISPKRGKALLKKNVVHGNVPVVAGGLKPAAYHNKSNTEAPVITISASGANAGFVQIWLQKVWSSDSSFIDTSVTNDVYFWYLLLKTRQSEIFDAQTGSAQPHIYPKHISQMPLESIDLNEVSHFNKQITPIFQKIGQNKAENGNLNKLKQVLLDQLF